ncbi:hypothetical protein P691DRAFT_709628, partial [Macrolepiota fuliginosa MF-IS2]
GGSSGGAPPRGGGSTSGPKSGPVKVGGTSKPASSSSHGGGPSSNIPAGHPFAGRLQGGGTRDQVYGTKQYGSGYPDISGRGVTDRGFPFYFWPITWGGVAGFGTTHYLNSASEYGNPDNTTRPGGPQYTAAFTSISTNSTFRLLADNTTITSLISDITSSCNSSNLASPSSITASPYPNNGTGPPLPEQAVQYYRASSVVLTLDGYNNTAVLNTDETIPDSPLPNGTDLTLLGCLNSTIGGNVPLI